MPLRAVAADVVESIGCAPSQCDGIVYADRTPQTDYWQVRKVYAQVQLTVPSFEVGPGR